MTRLVHLSDLHFGRDNEALVDPLLDAIAAANPTMVALSGDLTQRARETQFARARAFLDRIAAPVVVVPGNHDVPLDNLFQRFLTPFRRYHAAITRDMEPRWENDEVTVLGLNSVNPYAWQSGRVGRRALRAVRAAFAHPDLRRTRIVVMHHPLTLPPGSGKRPVRGARHATAQLASAGADLVLCGHLHGWRAELIHDDGTGAEAILAQVGTGLSTRLRGEVNDFNVIDIRAEGLSITRHAAEDDMTFKGGAPHHFRRSGPHWEAA